jgi:hypothetical protein
MSASYCHINSIALSTAHCHVSSALPRHHHISSALPPNAMSALFTMSAAVASSIFPTVNHFTF